MINIGSPADFGVVGIPQAIPQFPGHPFAAGGQKGLLSVGQGGGTQVTVGEVQTIPHPPGQPFSAGGQVSIPPVGHRGGVQMTVGILHTTPHPPEQPFPAGGQVKVPSEGHGGGVQTTAGVETCETVGAGEVGTAMAATGIPATKRRRRKMAQGNLLSILVIVREFIKGIGLQTGSTFGFSRILRLMTFFVKMQ
jgi:hypothetical protein